jgi:glutamate racemase
VPTVGVVVPGALEALAKTKNNCIGVLGTEATIRSESYPKTLKRLSKVPGLRVRVQACPLFVPLVEEGWTEHAVTRDVASIYLAKMRRSGVDTVILGCTHYPLLKRIIGHTIGKAVNIVDSGDATALEVENLLTKKNLMNKAAARGSVSFFVSDSPEKFKRLALRFFGRPVKTVEQIACKT